MNQISPPPQTDSGNLRDWSAMQSVDRVIFTCDLLRIDDRKSDRFAHPSEIDVAWLEALIGDHVRTILGLPARRVTLTEPDLPINRADVVHHHNAPFSSQGWAELRDGLSPEMTDRVADIFSGSLVVGYELPPFMTETFTARGVPYLDITISPVRFLPDYLLAIRSNVTEFDRALQTMALPDEAAARFARMLKARAQRRMFSPTSRIEPGAVVFAGQTEVDSSLIHDRRMATDLDIALNLQDLSAKHGRVFYKKHPHRKDMTSIEGLAKDNKNIIILERNIYDILGCGSVRAVYSMSSSVLFEAEYFDIEAIRLLPGKSPHRRRGAPVLPGQYKPFGPSIFDAAFWRAVLKGERYAPPQAGADINLGLLKEALGMKWG